MYFQGRSHHDGDDSDRAWSRGEGDNTYRPDRDRRRNSRDGNRDRDIERDRDRRRNRDLEPDENFPDRTSTAKYDEPWDKLPPPVPPWPPSTSTSTLDQGETDANYYSLEDEPSDKPNDHRTNNDPSLSGPNTTRYGRPETPVGEVAQEVRQFKPSTPSPNVGPKRLRLNSMLNDGYEIPLDFPHTDDDESETDHERGRYKSDERGQHTTVDLGLGIYKPVIGKKKAPPHHSNSKDATPAVSQVSRIIRLSLNVQFLRGHNQNHRPLSQHHYIIIIVITIIIMITAILIIIITVIIIILNVIIIIIIIIIVVASS